MPIDMDSYSESPIEGEPAWHRDAKDPEQLRWWNGSNWTDSVYPKPSPEHEPPHMPGSTQRLDLSIWTADAVVLFDWLMSVDLEAIPINHPADKQALMDLLSELESAVQPPTQEDIEAARHDVAMDMSW